MNIVNVNHQCEAKYKEGSLWEFGNDNEIYLLARIGDKWAAICLNDGQSFSSELKGNAKDAVNDMKLIAEEAPITIF